jgi:ATP adenylyltransferase
MDWAAATANQIETARRAGVLAPIETKATVLCDQGIDYIVRVVAGLARKPRAAQPKPEDPFAPPYATSLYVGDIAPGHAGLLNKFPVLTRHLLIVTRAFEPQTGLLRADDFEAMLRVLASWDGLAFYNGGPKAGASQAHRHLQMVDLPGCGNRLPFAEALAASAFENGLGRAPEMPFPHAVARLPQSALAAPAAGGVEVSRLYQALLHAIGRPAGRAGVPDPYNLLATRNWLWAVPRSQSACNGIEVNALGFAGALMVASERQLAELRSLGPARALQALCPQ